MASEAGQLSCIVCSFGDRIDRNPALRSGPAGNRIGSDPLPRRRDEIRSTKDCLAGKLTNLHGGMSIIGERVGKRFTFSRTNVAEVSASIGIYFTRLTPATAEQQQQQQQSLRHNGHFINDEMHTPATIFSSKRACLGFLTETRPRLEQPNNDTTAV